MRTGGIRTGRGRLFAALSAAVAAMLMVPPAAGAAELKPDLRTRAMQEIYLCRQPQDRCRAPAGETYLQFGNAIVNRGAGPLEIVPERKQVACDGVANGRKVYQKVFRDSNGDGVFQRKRDTNFREQRAGCVAFHADHHHFHFRNFSLYELRDSNGVVVEHSPKIGFCLLDAVRVVNLPGSPSGPYYRGDCYRQSFFLMGISVGWVDVYGPSLSGQELDVTPMDSGIYCLRSTADPTDRLDESDELNNARTMKLQLNLEALEVTKLKGRCLA